MSQDSGFIVNFDEIRRSDLLSERMGDPTYSFSDALSVYDWELNEISIALLSFSSGTIDSISLAKKGRRVVTSKYRVEFSSITSLNELKIGDIEKHLGSSISRYFIRSSQGTGGRIPKETWKAVVSAIKIERPNVSSELDRLISLTKYAGVRLSGDGTDLLIQEREALGISLDIFSGGANLRSQVLSQWAPTDENVSNLNVDEKTATLQSVDRGLPSFLRGLPEKFRQEESAIQHDLMNWGGGTAIHLEGISSFEQGSRQLSIIYANRNTLEKTLGVDLIYFNDAYNQFVLVQYKLMKEESGIATYRPDKQFNEELQRMDQFYNRYQPDEQPENDAEFRTNPDGFFFKLVPNNGLIAASGELSKGMYLTRQYVHFLLGPSGPVGPRGGSLINFENAGRYMSNSEFISNVRLGRLGSFGTVSKSIAEVIRTYYETGRAVMIAKESERKWPHGIS